jgi:hypothetical protein
MTTCSAARGELTIDTEFSGGVWQYGMVVIPGMQYNYSIEMKKILGSSTAQVSFYQDQWRVAYGGL